MRDAEEAIQTIQAGDGVGRYSNQIRRFFAIQEGDLIVATLPYFVAIGRATGGLFHDPAYSAADKVNQRRVDFPKDKDGRVVKLPRVSFSEAFQRRLRVRGITVNDLGEFQQEIVDAYNKVNSGEEYSWSLQMDEKAGNAADIFKKSLLQNIQSGRTNLQTGGVGLEYLVKELLEKEGYQAEVLSKHAFQGSADADIKASRTDPCKTVNLLVQVKHHQGFTNEHGLTQLAEIRRQKLPEYADHELVFCTSASIPEDFQEKEEFKDVTMIDGEGLVDWIAQHIVRLSPETKNCLGICEIPTVL